MNRLDLAILLGFLLLVSNVVIILLMGRVIGKEKRRVVRLRKKLEAAELLLAEEKANLASALAEEKDRSKSELASIIDALRKTQEKDRPFTRLRYLFSELSFVEAIRVQTLGEHIGIQIRGFIEKPLPDYVLAETGGGTRDFGDPWSDPKGIALFGQDLWTKIKEDDGYKHIHDALIKSGSGHIDWAKALDHLHALSGHAGDLLSMSMAGSLVVVSLVSRIAVSVKLRKIEAGVERLLGARGASQLAEFEAVYLVCAEEFLGARTNKSRLLVQRQRLIRLRRELLEDLNARIETSPDLDSWFSHGSSRRFNAHFDGSLKGLEIAIACMLIDYCLAFETETITSFISVTVKQEARQIKGMIERLELDIKKLKDEGEEVRAIKGSLHAFGEMIEQWLKLSAE